MSEARQPRNRALRLLVPLAIVLGGVGIFYLYVVNGVRNASPDTAKQPAATTPAPSMTPPADPIAADPTTTDPIAADPIAADPSAPSDEQPAAQAPAASQPVAAAPIDQLRARRFPATTFDPVGDLTPKADGGTFQLQLEFSPFGAGLERVRLANHFEHVDRKDHEVIQRFVGLNGSDRVGVTPFAAAFVNINGRDVDLSVDVSDTGVTLWRQVRPGTFEAVIVEPGTDGAEREVARVTRTYQLLPGSYEFTIRQSVENLTDRPLKIVWNQYGPADLPLGVIRYGGDVRRVRFGYLLPPANDSDRIVLGSEYRLGHDNVLGSPVASPSNMPTWPPKTLWPDQDALEDNLQLAWAGMTSRYFAVAMHPVPGASADLAAPAGAEKRFTLVERIDRLAIPAPHDQNQVGRTSPGVMVLRVSSPAIDVAPGGSADLSMMVYAGPLSKKYVDAEPAANFFGLERLVIFTFGGPCAFCTFQPVAVFLRWFLGTLHDYVLFDWALAIIFLVLCVRTCLHPVTRWSQLSMLRFSKQMQAFAPKQKAIQEKYKNDPAKMREEITKLMREGHVDYGAAMKGCLPSLFQTPIWIALYAMIYFTFELRHEAAFYGFIQQMTGGRWTFLADLSEPDNFLNLNHIYGVKGLWVPLISGLMGPIEGINILPLLLGVVFYIQQKYMQPPPSATMTPEQEQQQKIMKVMMVVMFPVFMYNAPAALSLYFLVNSTLGILESKWIRAHADELEKRREAHAAAGGTPQYDRKGRNSGTKQPAKPGFFARLQAEVERRQKLVEEQQRQAKKNRKP